MTGEKGVGKMTILNLFPGENILEIDLDLNEIFKKSINTFEFNGIKHIILKVIDFKEMINNINSIKNLLKSIDIICIVTNSALTNIKKSQKFLLKLKQEIQNVDYYIIANFQDNKGKAIEIEKIEEIFGEKTFEFSAVQKDSRDMMISILKDILELSNREKENLLPTKFDTIFLEIEEAKILESEGEHLTAAKKFLNVASQFKNLSSETKVEEEKKEIDVLFHLCKAWENLIYGEENQEVDKFLEAGNHFIEVSKTIHDHKLKLLALGNSIFCNALKLVVELDKVNVNDIDQDFFLKIKTMINNAADLYNRGGFEKEAQWAITKLSYFEDLIATLKKI